MRGRTEIVIYFDPEMINCQRISTGPKFEGKVKDVVETVYPKYFAYDPGDGRIIRNPNYKQLVEE